MVLGRPIFAAGGEPIMNSFLIKYKIMSHAREWRARRTIGCRGGNRNGMGWGGTPWEGTLGSPKGSHGRGSMGEGALGSSRDPMGGGPGPLMGGEALGAQGIPWEGALGAPSGIPLNGNAH